MKSPTVVFTGPGEVRFIEEEIAGPGADHILVKTEVSLISPGTELTCLDRRFEEGSHWEHWVQYPFYPGYSNVGVVEAVGDGVTAFAPGDRVFSRTQHAGHVCVPADMATKVPDNLASDCAAWTSIGKIVQVGVRRAEHRLGDRIAIVGLGALGQIAVRYAALCGAREIIAIDPMEPRLEWAQQGGATHCLQGTAAGCGEELHEITSGGADVVYEITGHPNTLAEALYLVRPLGKVVLIGDTGFPSAQHLAAPLVTYGISLLGAHDSNPAPESTIHTPWSHQAMMELFLHYLSVGQIRLEGLNTHRFPAEDAEKAYDQIRADRRTTMGILLDW